MAPKTSENAHNPPDAAVKQAAEVAADRFLNALREQLVPPLQNSTGEVLRGAEERVNKLGAFAVSERMKTVSERMKSSIEEVLATLRDQVGPAMHAAAREALRESESKLNALAAAAVSERLAAMKGALVADITQNVLRSLPAGEASLSPAAELLSIQSSIESSSSQPEILRALLDGSSIFCSRCAIFVVRGGNLAGWQGRGFAEDSIQITAVDCSTQPIAKWISEKAPVSIQASTWKAPFLDREGRAHDGKGWILPLLVRDRVVAILFADAGHDGSVSLEELQLLVRSTGNWLEIVATRKASPIESAPQPTATQAEALAVTPSRSATPPTMSPADEELHRKAQRFAKLLVDEIKLYNQAKVTEGRAHRDLYSRLRDDIEKSKATYDKRYASTVAASANYFQAEVVRILAENDLSLMGSDFPR